MKLNQIIPRFLVLYFWWVNLLSCQTTQIISPNLPANIERIFSSCSELEGGVYISIYQNKIFVAGSEMDWISKKNGSWSAEAYNSFGQTIGRIDADTLTPSLLVKIPKVPGHKMSVHSDQRMFLDSHYIGLSINEVPCLLKGKIPIEWRKRLTAYRQGKDSAELEVESDSRNIKIVAKSVNEKKISFCFYVTWSQYLGLISHKYEVCHLGSSPSSTFLEYESGVRIKWAETPSI